MLKSDLQDLILSQNPWLNDGKAPDHLAPPVERSLAKHLYRRVLSRSLKRYLVIFGPRRVGKTTVMYQTVRHLLREGLPASRILWVNLDHPELMDIKLDEIARFAVRRSGADLNKPALLFLDELIYAKNWDLWLKTFYDEKRPVQIIASSSASAALHSKTRESGVGRWEEIPLFPYLLSELLQLKGTGTDISAQKRLSQTIEQSGDSPSMAKGDLEAARKELIALGGFPEILSEQQNRRKQLQKQAQNLIRRYGDMRQYQEKSLIFSSLRVLELEEHIKKPEMGTSLKPLTEKEKIREIQQRFKLKVGEKKIKEILEEWDQGMEMDEEALEADSDNLMKDMDELKKQERDIQTGESALFHKAQQTLRDAVERAVYKDIPQSYRIDSPMTLERLFYTLAGQITGLLSLQSLAESVSGVSPPTLERYLSYLVESYLIFLLPNYAKTEEAVQRRGRKIYFLDGAIRNSAVLKGKEEVFDSPTELGKLQENLVAAHLHALSQQAGIRIYHYRRGKYEVDFIYDDPERPLAFEVGSSSQHSFRGLEEFLKEHERFFGSCYYVAPGINFISAKHSENGIGRLPLDHFLRAVGIQQEWFLKKRLGAG